MATTLINNLYPPVMDTYQPAFDKTTNDGCKVYFTLSNFNNINDINQYVQVSVKYQFNNQTALKKALYPLEIAFKKIYIDEDGYYVYVSKNDLEKEEFYINNFYKIQIRFMTTDIPETAQLSSFNENEYHIVEVGTNVNKASWINNYSDYFSEWSKVCLIKGIETPEFEFEYLDIDKTKEVIITNTSFSQIVGSMTFATKDTNGKPIEKEYLKYYKITIYDKTLNETVVETDKILTEENNPNIINYDILYMFDNKHHYIIYLDYITNNGYKNSIEMKFYTSNTYESDLIGDFSCTFEQADARIKVTLDISDFKTTDSIFNTYNATQQGGIVFRRSSNKDNFKYWEDIKIVYADEIFKILTVLPKDKQIYKWYDYTIESGVMYQYGVQKFNGKGQRNSLKRYIDSNGDYGIWMCDMDDMFLTTKDNQLKITFDPQVSSFSHTVMENKTDTIGSKYAYFYRNGTVDYKTFSISGTISHLMDENYVFLNKEDFSLVDYYEKHKDSVIDGIDYIIDEDLNRKSIYGDYYDKYIEFNEKTGVSNDRDYIFEKDFRDKVIKFLYDGKAKLFRSPTEGNILIRLMDISFTPNQTLGRLTYSFSATAYEVDECSFDNYVNYNIHSISSLNNYYDDVTSIDSDLIKIGELDFVAGTASLKDMLEEKYGSTSKPLTKTINSIDYSYSLNKIEWVKIYFEGTEGPIGRGGVEQTLLITNDSGEYQIIDTNDELATNYKTVFNGFLIEVNNIPILVSRLGKYEIHDSNIPITDITFNKMSNYGINVRVEYRVTLNRSPKETIEDKVSKYYFSVGVGQLVNDYDKETDIIKIIKERYAQETSILIQKINSIRKLWIEADPGAIMILNGQKALINNTGQIEFSEGDGLSSLSFAGYQLIKRISDNEPLNLRPEEYYIKTNKYYKNINEILSPKANYVYNFGSENKPIYKIYFKSNWYNFEDYENYGIININTFVMIKYIYELERGIV
jgi:hypothetical protein